MYVGKSPVPLTPELLKLGQTKFNTYCQPCHDKTGSGQGIVPTRVPTWQPSNLTEERVVQFADGDIFNVIPRPAFHAVVSLPDRGGRPLGDYRLRAGITARRARHQGGRSADKAAELP